MFPIVTEVCKTENGNAYHSMLQVKEVDHQSLMLTLVRLKLDQPHHRLHSMLSL